MATVFDISTFRTALDGGAHANMFEVVFTLPTGPTATGLAGITSYGTVLCKAAAMPAMTLGIIEVPFRGRRTKIPGDRSYGEWTATFINSADQKLRSSFETWMDYIASGNFGDTVNGIAPAAKTASNYKSVIEVKQLNDAGTTIKNYKLQNSFPSDISAIDLSYDTVDAIEEFTVTFQYSHFENSAAAAAAAAE